jgi:hypothetical protein
MEGYVFPIVDLISDFFAWAISVLIQFIWLIGGFVSVILYFWEKQRGSIDWNKLRIVLICTLALAVFLSWREKQQALLSSERPTSKVLAIYPAVQMKDAKKNAVLGTLISIINPGPPTIFHDFTATLQVNGKSIAGEIQTVPSFVIPGKSGLSIAYGPTDSIVDRASRQPIPQGGSIDGILLTDFSNIEARSIDLSTLKITFRDARENLFETPKVNGESIGKFAIAPNVGTPIAAGIRIVKEGIVRKNIGDGVIVYFVVTVENDGPDVGVFHYAENILALKADTVNAELLTLRKIKGVVLNEIKKGGAPVVKISAHSQVFFNPTGFKLTKSQYADFLNGKYTLYAVGVVKTTDGNQTVPFCAMNMGNPDAIMACPIGEDKL